MPQPKACLTTFVSGDARMIRTMSTHREPRILAGIALHVLQVAGRIGIDRRALLAEASIEEHELLDRDRRIPLSVHLRLCKALILRTPGVPLALGVADGVDPGAFGALGYTLRNSPTLGDALRLYCRYTTLMIEGGAVALRDGDAGLRIDLSLPRPLVELRHPVEGLLSTFVALSRQLTGVRWRPAEVTFRHQRTGEPGEHADFFGSEVHFSSHRSGMTIPRSALRLPILGARSDSYATFHAHVQRMLSTCERSAAVADRARALIATALCDGPVRQAQIATAMAMSSRTLSRRLQAESQTFANLLDQTRRELALCYLRDPALNVVEVAFLLGYREPSTFFRSFKGWTGRSPGSWRREVGGISHSFGAIEERTNSSEEVP